MRSLFRRLLLRERWTNQSKRARRKGSISATPEALERRCLLTNFGNQILYDGEPDSVPSLGNHCMEYMSEAPGEGIDGGTALATEHTSFHRPNYTFYCGGEDRRDFTPYDAFEFLFRSPNADPGEPTFFLNSHNRQSHVISVLDYIEGGVIDNTWRRVRVPLSDLQTTDWDLGNVERIQFEPEPATQQYFIDGIRLLDLNAPDVASLTLHSSNVVRVTIDGRYDPDTIRNLSDYEIVSTTDPDYVTALNPIDTGAHIRFQELSDSSSAAVVRFDVLLEFDEPFENGHAYELSVAGIADHAGNVVEATTLDFAFDDTTQHNPHVVHVNQVGYLTDGPKLGYVGGYTGDLGGAIWAVGADNAGAGAVFRYDDQAGWQADAVPMTGTLRDVAATREDQAWAVGDGGTILQWDGQFWQQYTSQVTEDLLGIEFGPTGLGWIVGANGVSLQFDGADWNVVSTGVTETLRDVWLARRLDLETLADLDRAFAVGDNGTILFWDGAMWSQQSAGLISEDLHAIGGKSSAALFAAGSSGKVIRRLHQHWRDDVATPVTAATLRSVIQSHLGNTWFSGDAGTLWHTEGFGSPINVLDSGTGNNLAGVVRHDSRQFFALGASGTLVTDTGQGAGTDADSWEVETLGSGDVTFHATTNVGYGALRLPAATSDVTIRDAITKAAVTTASLELRDYNDILSGEEVYAFDFSSLTTPGVYEAFVPGIGVSDPFVISDDVYRAAAITAGRGFLYQRSGLALEEPYADFRFVRPENHGFGNGPTDVVVNGWFHPSLLDSPLYAGEDVFVGDLHAPAVAANSGLGTPTDVTQGWFDAGDYGKYIGPAVDALWHLLTAYEIAPDHFTDGLWNIPESGNGVSDLLDEARWELEWLLKMQNPTTGGVYNKVVRQTWDGGMPHEDLRPQFIMEMSTDATGAFAAIAASASRIFAAHDAAFSATLLQQAELAWQFLNAHPDHLPNGGAVNPPGVRSGPYTDGDDLDNRLWASTELYRTTGLAVYRQYFEDWFDSTNFHPDQQGQPGWKHHYVKAYWAYQAADHPDVRTSLQEGLRSTYFIAPVDTQILPRTEMNAYHMGARSDVVQFIGFGSHSRSLGYAFPALVAWHLTGDDKYFEAAAINANVQLGANPLSQSWVTGVGARYPMQPLHKPSQYDGVVEPIPGLPLFGVTHHLSNGNAAGFTTQSDDNNFPFTLDGNDPLPILRRFADEDANPNMAEFSVIGQALLLSTLHILTPAPTGGQIIGNVFLDADRDSAWDANEPTSGGFIVYLDADADGQRDPGESFSLTDGAGQFALTNVAAGQHTLALELQAGFVQTHPTALTHTITVGSGTPTLMGYAFGVREISEDVPEGNVEGRVWYDLNEDGEQHPQEPGLDHWTVYVDTNNNGELDSGENFTVTGPDGSYVLSGVAAGTSTVTVVRPPGWLATQPIGGAYSVTLIPGEGWDNVNFGNRLDAGGVPAAADLQAVSDSGLSDSDNLTNRNDADADSTLQFQIENTIPGAEIRLYLAGQGVDFASGQDIYVGNSSSTTAADLDNDGDNDIVVGSQGTNTVAWIENLGGGSFGSQQVITTSAAQLKGVSTGDMNGDGYVDVLSASAADGKFAWYANNGDGTFGPQSIIASGLNYATYALIAADIDGDGDLDAVGGTRYSTLRWYPNLDGNGTFGGPQIIEPIHVESQAGIFAADLDGDSDIDLIAGRETTGEILWFENDGSGGFTAGVAVSADFGALISVTAGDIDGDGDNDILASSFGSGTMTWFENKDGIGGFSVAHPLITDGARVPSAQIADVDGDGDNDVIAAHAHDIEWFPNAGDGTLGPAQSVGFNVTNPNSVVAADINGNGRLDVFAALNGGRVTWFENESVDTFISQTTATGWQTAVSTSGTLALVDGPHDFRTSQQQTGDDERFAADALTVTVDTSGPTSVTVDSLETEDSSPALTGTVDDAAASVSVTVNGIGPFLANVATDGTWQLAAGQITPPLDPATYDVQVTASDAAGNAVNDSSHNELVVVPSNEPPVADAGGTYTIVEGHSVTLNAGASSDPDVGQTLTLTWTINGTSLSPTTGTTTSLTWAELHSLGVNDGSVTGTNYVVQLLVEDNGEPQLSDSATTTLTVINAAPDVTVTSGSVSVTEGQTATNSGTWSDPGADVVTVSASIGQTIIHASGTWTWTFTSNDGPESETVLITASDSDGAVSTATFLLQVLNVAPVVTDIAVDAPTTSPSRDGDVSISGSFVDPGTGETHTAVVDWGDGTPLQSVAVDQATHTFSGTHSYATGGLFAVTVSINDGNESDTELLTAAVTGVRLSDGTLQIVGTGGRDMVWLRRRRSELEATLRLHGQSFERERWSVSEVSQLHIVLSAGNDFVSVHGNVSQAASIDVGEGRDLVHGGSGPSTIDGGAGNDQIHAGDADDVIAGGAGNDVIFAGRGDDLVDGGDGRDLLFGGHGNDIILGGEGNDLLFGQSDRDLLIGGSGRDMLFGGGGQDILIGSATSHDSDHAALRGIMSEWTSRRGLSRRVSNLRTGRGLNGTATLNASTIESDGERDMVFGGGGRDWGLVDDLDLTFARFRDLVERLE